MQSKLNKTELDYKEPGWTKVAHAAHAAAKGPLGKMMGGKKGAKPEKSADSSNTTAQEQTSVGVQKTAEGNFFKESDGEYKLGEGTQMAK